MKRKHLINLSRAYGSSENVQVRTPSADGRERDGWIELGEEPQATPKKRGQNSGRCRPAATA